MLDYVQALGPNIQLSREVLSKKLCLLFALAKASRVSELCKLDTRFMRILPDGAEFVLTGPTKTQRGGAPKRFFVPNLPDNSILCPIQCLQTYINVTKPVRLSPQQDQLLLSTRRPFLPVSSSTVSRWVTSVIRDAGVGQGFTAHSTRSASATTARAVGVPLADVLASADWSQENTFVRHYYRPNPLGRFGRAVLEAGGD